MGILGRLTAKPAPAADFGGLGSLGKTLAALSAEAASYARFPDGEIVDFAKLASLGFLPVLCDKCGARSPIDWQAHDGTIRCFGCEPPPPIMGIIKRIVFRLDHPQLEK